MLITDHYDFDLLNPIAKIRFKKVVVKVHHTIMVKFPEEVIMVRTVKYLEKVL